eukprot:1137494-Pelagomonas_calceolata.AAC.1
MYLHVAIFGIATLPSSSILALMLYFLSEFGTRPFAQDCEGSARAFGALMSEQSNKVGCYLSKGNMAKRPLRRSAPYNLQALFPHVNVHAAHVCCGHGAFGFGPSVRDTAPVLIRLDWDKRVAIGWGKIRLNWDRDGMPGSKYRCFATTV